MVNVRDRQRDRSRFLNSSDGFVDAQFEPLPRRFPKKEIIFAIVMFIVGSLFLVIGSLLFVGIIGGDNSEYDDRALPLLIIGSLLFIPGSYHTHIAYKAWCGVKGYSYHSIPVLDE